MNVRLLKARVRDALAARVHKWSLGSYTFQAPTPLMEAEWPAMAWSRIVQTDPAEGSPVKVGRYSSLNDHSYIFLGGNHQAGHVSTFHFRRAMGLPDPEPPGSNGPVVVGHDVWVGWDAVIMSGVTIGDGAIVAARAVVTRDVEPYSIVGGIPAKHIGWRFDEDTRAALLRIRWWDWPLEKVVEHVDELQSDDLSGFIARHDPARHG